MSTDYNKLSVAVFHDLPNLVSNVAERQNIVDHDDVAAHIPRFSLRLCSRQQFLPLSDQACPHFCLFVAAVNYVNELQHRVTGAGDTDCFFQGLIAAVAAINRY
ncbi:hypothetical protein SAMN05216345_11768 [Cupriavidus sp. YR651]|nr:hypothetical protein SAMN05216345_11768 [Cupriavidus sp. YR651]